MPKNIPSIARGEQFDRLLQNIAEATGNDAEIEALREIIGNLWHLLTDKQKAEFLANCGAIEQKAARWASNPGSRPT